jgi:hypothetical protein
MKGETMKILRKTMILLTLALAYPGLLHALDVAGEWHGEFDSMVGKQVYIYTLSMEGDSLTGKAEADIAGEKYQSKLSDIKLNNDEIQFVETLDYQGMPLIIQYKGKIIGEEIHFTRTVGEFASEEFVAKRVQPKESPEK